MSSTAVQGEISKCCNGLVRISNQEDIDNAKDLRGIYYFVCRTCHNLCNLVSRSETKEEKNISS